MHHHRFQRIDKAPDYLIIWVMTWNLLTGNQWWRSQSHHSLSSRQQTATSLSLIQLPLSLLFVSKWQQLVCHEAHTYPGMLKPWIRHWCQLYKIIVQCVKINVQDTRLFTLMFYSINNINNKHLLVRGKSGVEWFPRNVMLSGLLCGSFEAQPAMKRPWWNKDIKKLF